MSISQSFFLINDAFEISLNHKRERRKRRRKDFWQRCGERGRGRILWYSWKKQVRRWDQKFHYKFYLNSIIIQECWVIPRTTTMTKVLVWHKRLSAMSCVRFQPTSTHIFRFISIKQQLQREVSWIMKSYLKWNISMLIYLYSCELQKIFSFHRIVPLLPPHHF